MATADLGRQRGRVQRMDWQRRKRGSLEIPLPRMQKRRMRKIVKQSRKDIEQRQRKRQQKEMEEDDNGNARKFTFKNARIIIVSVILLL